MPQTDETLGHLVGLEACLFKRTMLINECSGNLIVSSSESGPNNIYLMLAQRRFHVLIFEPITGIERQARDVNSSHRFLILVAFCSIPAVQNVYIM